MPSLEEYLGGILASLSEARVLGDIQTLQTAEIYAKSELLRHFPVPRMRISSAELSIPIAIESFETKRTMVVPKEESDQLRLALVSELIREAGIRRPSGAMSTAIADLVNPHLDVLSGDFSTMGPQESKKAFVENVVKSYLAFMRSSPPTKAAQEIDPKRVTASVQALAERLIIGSVGREGLSKLEVIAESHRLREQRPSDVIMIKMNISEEGMEWQFMENAAGETQRKLLQE